ncbi:DNA cytosine methyltransferase [Mycoplasmopsis felis]|uniref:DNA cytosine methyltransferase n=1 Tax=Mycoplasmopsis felis TaxID=33923 RepID=UPI002AFE5A1B|nr:DNA cytosine methyltransferase [Mycoplasmopsis felis]WQQ10882.1 DNA cytosine methyltransferase [Mycoplasmopsis felis]
MKRYKSIELFAGAGGLAIGLEKAGFEHIGLVEIDKNAANTLRLNRTKWNVIQEDISILSNQDLEKKFNFKLSVFFILMPVFLSKQVFFKKN